MSNAFASKHVVTAKNPRATIEELLETVFSTRPVPRYYNMGSNTSTMALRGVGVNEKGSLESETVKYGHEPNGTETRK
jgi:hypothetical protein